MAVLTATLTHLGPGEVAAQARYLERLAPDSRFVVCHGGRREHFEAIAGAGLDALFIADESLRGPNRDQSYVGLLKEIHDARVAADPEIDLVYLVEYDHLILAPDFESRLAGVMERSTAGLLGKYAGYRNDTNWPHFTRYRRDARLNEYVERISVRDDPSPRLGCLGSGMLFRRDALAALAELDGVPHAYVELLIPTLVHHLGFEVEDFDTHGDVYANVRWRPEYSAREVIALKRAGAAFAHPFKEIAALEAIAGS